MPPEKLTEATAAGFDLIAAMLETLLGPSPDPRLHMLRTLVHTLAPVPPPVIACPRCHLPCAEMEWHPSENRNCCPRCCAPLKPPATTP